MKVTNTLAHRPQMSVGQMYFDQKMGSRENGRKKFERMPRLSAYMTLGKVTLSILTLITMTLSIMNLIVALNINDTWHNDT